MDHRLIASLIVGTGLACALNSPVAAQAQDKGTESKKSDTSRERGDSGEVSEGKIDKAIEVYESRTEEDLDQTRKDIERLRKQLEELNDMRLDMVMAVAQLRADLTAHAAVAQQSGSDSADQDSDSASKERKRVRAIELSREYRQIQELLRNEVQQAKGSTEQFVALLRSLRAQQRQRDEQLKAERERRKQAETASKSKDKDDSNP
jgi:hypothetical protein